jgi:pyridoxine kinase
VFWSNPFERKSRKVRVDCLIYTARWRGKPRKACRMKKVVAIHDMSGFGRCSLTVAIPIISAMGVQVCPVPTAVLSTHTGGFGDMAITALTEHITKCCDHYADLGLEFDAVYSGFLASSAQIDGCLRFFEGYPDTLKIVDPVMGDNGKTYKTYTPELCKRMCELVRVADIITPNLTEAAILLDEKFPPPDESFSIEKTDEWLNRLCEMSKMAVITGVQINGRTCNIGLERGGQPVRIWYEQIPAHYPGTGDIFASVMTGTLLKGGDFRQAIHFATEFSRAAVKTTYLAKGENRNGVMFEMLLGRLTECKF